MTEKKPWPEKWLTITDDEVVMLGDAARDIIWSYKDDIYTDDLTEEQKAEFLELFELFPDKAIQGNPNEDYYQGMTFVKVIRRKSDDKLFGYEYWKPVAKYDDYDIDPNGEQFGYEIDTNAPEFNWATDYASAYVWRPVEPFTITGYAVIGD